MEKTELNKNIWLIVCNNENWDIAVANGVFGIDKAAGRIKNIKQGDKYVLYLTKIGFVGWGNITGPYYESNRRIWKDKKYKYRFPIASPETPGKVLSPAAIKDDLTFIKDKRKWPVHFRGDLLKIPQEDFELIKKSLLESNTNFNEFSKDITEAPVSTKMIGDKLHNRMHSLFENMGFSILESNYNKPGPDIIIEDPQSKDNSKIIVQCRNTQSSDKTYVSLQSLIDEYASKIKTYNAVVAIIVISGYKLSKNIDPVKVLEKNRIALWTDDIINYYEDLADKISGFSRHQLLADMKLHLQFGENRIFDSISVRQNEFQFYVFAVEPDWLLKTTSVVRRINFSGSIGGYQRLLNATRIKKQIPSYLDSGNWNFPNAIVCATQNEISIDNSSGKINFPSRYGLFWILDGQHRLYGFANSDARLNKNNKIICAVIDTQFLGEDSEVKQAQIFIDLNMHAKKVDRALLLELKSTLGLQDIPLEIVLKLGENNIFKGAIRGYSINKQGSINLTTFATNQAIKKITSKSGPLLNKKDIEDSEVADYCFKKILNYFKCVSEIFKKEWANHLEYILKTDRGVIGLLNLYIKILERYKDEKNIDEKIIKVLNSLKKSNFNFSLKFLKGKYLGAGGPVDLTKDWASYITKEITNFDPTVFAIEEDSFIGKFGDLDSKIKKLQEWFGKLEGDVRGQLMHIDETTFELLSYLNKSAVKSIKIIFGDVDDEKKTKESLKKIKEDGLNIVLTKAKKPEPAQGSLYHTRWLGSDKYEICLDCDLKKKAMKNATYTMRLIKWQNHSQLKEFDSAWSFAELFPEYGSFKFEYNWG